MVQREVAKKQPAKVFEPFYRNSSVPSIQLFATSRETVTGIRPKSYRKPLFNVIQTKFNLIVFGGLEQKNHLSVYTMYIF